MVDKGKQVDTSAAPPDPQSAFGAVMPVIADLLERGTRAFALGSWEEAIEHFGELASITEETFGSESQRYADCLVMYGRALLQHAIEQSALLAQKTLAEAAAGSKETEAKEGQPKEEGQGQGQGQPKATIQFEGEPDFRQVEEEAAAAAEEHDSGGDEDDDFAAAWNVLDLARVIQEKATDAKSQLKYAETLMLLGDVSMESENFGQAVKDFATALEVKRRHLKEDDRELAEIFYKVALAYEYNQESSKALELMSDVQRILNNRLDALRAESTMEAKEEADSLQEVLEDVAAKIEEWRAPPKPVDIGALTEGEQLLAERAKEMLKKAVESGQINDITNLVKSKRDKQSEAKRQPEDSEGGAKRPKKNS
ncbi:hypothetical protein H4R22_002287 [Coemansia sp. RSA 1290]|nr:hypothetical protein H4R22_002287 [Coemansia sp. RSA 1290]